MKQKTPSLIIILAVLHLILACGHQERFLTLQQEAREEGRGLWATILP